MDLELTPVEARVLGSLLEKERTVPATYPLTLKALLTACNQTTSRDPVMELDEVEVSAAMESLKGRRLVRRVLPSHGDRTVKYRQVADEVLGLDEESRAILTVLLLRGPQTAPELKTRCERIHRFGDVDAVQGALVELSEWRDPPVRCLSRGRGQRDPRWTHLLSEAPVEHHRDGPPEPAEGARPGDAARGPEAVGVPARDVAWATPTSGATPQTGRPAASGPAPASGPDLPGPLSPLLGTWVEARDDGPTIELPGDVAAVGLDRAALEVLPLAGAPVFSYRAWWPSMRSSGGPADRTRSVSRSEEIIARRPPDGLTGPGGSSVNPWPDGCLEAGFLRLTSDGEVELVVAMDLGAVEICAGLAEAVGEGVEIVLASSSATGSVTATGFLAFDRTYRAVGDELHLDLLRADTDRAVPPVRHHVRFVRRR